jgi:hypothetical protein
MDFSDVDRLGTRLFAINLRLAELDHDLRSKEIRVNRLEAQLEDARLARLMGESAGDPEEIAPELERTRGDRDTQRALVERVKQSQTEARTEYMLARVRQRREQRERAESVEGEQRP